MILIKRAWPHKSCTYATRQIKTSKEARLLRQFNLKVFICPISSVNAEQQESLSNKILESYPAAYNADYVEKGWYEWWKQSGLFSSRDDISKTEEVFSMILPPPNITGTLHLGHALTVTIQDVLARWNRMKGE